ncbi:MAG: GNAT family N-acetyltransferase [Bacteroidales bacterium]|nr:GNAT family N-acetyltransferase [Bacteroidales bacterium]
MNYELNIRKATKDDATLIAKVVAMAIGEESAILYGGDNYMNVFEEIALLEDSQYSYRNAFVAEINGNAVGAVVAYDGAELHSLRKATLEVILKHTGRELQIADETDASEFYLDSLAVLPEYRGRGIGAKLIHAVKEKAFNEYNKILGLLVDFENPDAERLYKSVGFERADVKDFLGHKMWHLVIRQMAND